MSTQNINLNLESKLTPKIILVTFRLPENPLFQPAEEILLHHILEKLNLNYEKIEYESLDVNNFFSKLPVIYFNGKIIINKNILNFLKNLIFQNQRINNDFNETINSLFFLLKDQLTFANDYYYYIKSREKLEKSKNKKMFANFKLFLNKRTNYELVSNTVLNSFPQIGKLENIFMSIETKLNELIKDAFNKIHQLIIKKDFMDKNQNLFFKLLIYSFIKEDKLLFSKVKRPAIENLKYEEDKMYGSIGTFFKEVEDNIIKNYNIKFSQSVIESFNQIGQMEIIQNFSIKFNPKSSKTNPEDIQHIQARYNYYHQLFTIGFFVSFGLLIYYLSSKKKN